MQFDPGNHIIKLCSEGMDLEGQGKPEKASSLFLQAWNESTNDFERSVSAHYVARHQQTITGKLVWDKKALDLASGLDNENIKEWLPSFYLNIAKCFEDLGEFEKAKENYEQALIFIPQLSNDGYGTMIKAGIRSGIERIKNYSNLKPGHK